MRNLSFKGLKCDKKYLIAVIIASICAIISGIVLYKLANVSIYFCNYAEDYIFFIFTFNNGQLIISHILSEIFYLYLFFLIGYLTRFVLTESCGALNKKVVFFAPAILAAVNTVIFLLLVNVVFRVVIVIV